MIDIDYFESFLSELFFDNVIIVDHFKEDLKFVDIDCFVDKPYKLTLSLSTDDIRIATISKEPELDFSLYDYIFKDMREAKFFLMSIKEVGVYPHSPH